MERRVKDLRFIADTNGYYVEMSMNDEQKSYYFKNVDSAYRFHTKMLEREKKTWIN